jgi:hypothetical protein
VGYISLSDVESFLSKKATGRTVFWFNATGITVK